MEIFRAAKTEEGVKNAGYTTRFLTPESEVTFDPVAQVQGNGAWQS